MREQCAEGFIEKSTPPWRVTLDQWIASAREVGVEPGPLPDDLERRMKSVLDIAERWQPHPKGLTLDLDDAIAELPKRREAVRADAACMPLVLLALRDASEGSYSRAMQAASIVRTDAPSSSQEMLWSLVEKPPEHAVDATMFERFFDTERDVERLSACIRSDDWRVAATAAWIAAHYGAKNDVLFNLLWERRQTRSPDFWPFAAVRACGVRADRTLIPALQTWRDSARGELRRSIGDAINALEGTRAP